MITAQELRQKYFEFFQSKGHAVIPSASLVPENDPTVLFTTAGMHPLVPYLLGAKHHGGKRVVSVQKCVRTDDIEEVGDAVHHTFFEMLGNWSFGDYFKKEAIEWSWEFLTDKKWLGIKKNHLAISIFAGDKDAPLDNDSKKIWLSLGVLEERIAALPKKNNWWGPAGQSGPCGPDTEMFYWSGEGAAPERFDPDDARWVEIWNDVFMQYNKKADGTFEPLQQKNVDTGMGLERTLAVLNGYDDNYRTELFWPIIEKIKDASGKKYAEYAKEMRIIADHVRAAVFLAADGVISSNVERGYILRRLLRRTIRYGNMLGIKGNFTADLGSEVIFMETYGEIYKEIKEKRQFIKEQFEQEEARFSNTLERGLKEFDEKLQDKIYEHPGLLGKVIFDSFSTYGFPPELSFEEIEKRGISLGTSEKEEAQKIYQHEFKKHQELSRTAAAGRFKGGLADNSEMTTKYHTATHLLHAALRQVLGKHVEQRGSNITAERLRFDFSHPQKMTPDEIKQVEDWVNDTIQKDYPVSCQEMTVEEAKKAGAIGLFGERYGEKVKVYTIGNPVETQHAASPKNQGMIVSREICGGPHVERTGILGKFKIQKEEASSSGVRRIKAILE
ncbi:MAG: alanine--tRNA ligase [Candidatus Komeilibacteria bacterium RIFCSPLOWO2_02_FULL_48_11]|uniref:Alanine--tRNA ligase n=1 Tax=Candidatus Komeilibacteria bacterium RIFCSPLOWO2_02_FULL_48_11 TaxID=1798553 RepID=A0A1G2BQW8_9BACT|nr:MAG: alanine--tRNA ligase [Candidatus Komeilibacteria bacterium RIFCSPLOWO2_02_FULL_48_11]